MGITGWLDGRFFPAIPKKENAFINGLVRGQTGPLPFPSIPSIRLQLAY